MVQPPRARRGEGRRGLSHDPAHLVCGETAVGQQRREWLRVRHGLLDDEGHGDVPAHIEHPSQSRLLDPRGAARGIDGRIGLACLAGKAQQHDGTIQGRVVGAPPFPPGLLHEAPAHGIPPAEDGTWTHAVHGPPFRSGRSPRLPERPS